ncbi:tRNA (guanine-N(1)-)-methyltransferase [Jeotgalicoccus aerolatus]|uniref:tRNA (guanine-N(1)-)-methyltransferase n=1 Tax=Jeotgalicoccus aerolatus TaxID=709510 RepID=A0A1G8WBT5_9STAP|nr:tRNA (guanosine(37)-N1)-methyltransferase TrmD [Jeotgalicoccus aerolatus]MBP1951465.1 tRNA (guanine37-N1)-methyltransferase [Jeotgalicoccus aerolatus]NMA81826.1 tRNA (guanosine(37)-N1)-methyltransferase TrmD [Jeotgalicoccus aerolatus]CAD2076506.1 tRNA (guanine-N(1)-)-methyltransferase [Jeotgalicoccus aerolatus]SDJ75030.1 tRNA (guanine37-N1)-methyltransferase [Jeotgalicoccus aerolatus]GGD97287.1 tRNA (guanine-N(1)-)-methyltransferase [Jeotgalicoccus aerolatus]
MNIYYLTLFPDMYEGVLGASILKRAKDKGIVDYHMINFRDFSNDKHNKVDDYPYGGGAGMVLKPEPVFEAMDSLEIKGSKRVVLMCPQGKPFDQKMAEEFAEEDNVVFINGHYEGYDERIRSLVTDEVSIGDYVLTGGELASMAMTDAIVRLIPDVLSNEASHQQDSFSTGMLEHPHYTRPREYRGMKVPDVLLSGNHKLIEEWRHEESLKRTRERRPDLLDE